MFQFKRRLRVDILTIFLGLFLSTILIIIYYFYERSSEAILKLGNDLIENANQASVTRLDNFLRPIPFIKTATFLLGDEILDIKDMQSLSSFMHIVLQSYPQLNNVYLTDKNGNMFVENKITPELIAEKTIPFIKDSNIPAKAKYLSQIITHSNNKTVLNQSYRDGDGHLIKNDPEEIIDFNPLTRPWYLGANNIYKQPWIGVYEFHGTQQHGITISFPIYIDNKFVGVGASDFSLNSVSEQLKLYAINHQGKIFIANNHDQVIGQGKNINHLTNSNGLIPIEELNDPLISKSYQLHHQLNKTEFIFKNNKVKYLAHFTPYAFSQNETWEIGSITPTETFVGSIAHTNEEIIIFAFIMLMIGIAFVIVFSHKVSKPIMRLAEETRDIVFLKFDTETKIKTHIYEVQLMIDAINSAKAALFSFAKYVPKTLVIQLLKTKMIAQVGGKKQNITVLFTDITNFTELTEKTDPEMLMVHLSEYLNILTQHIQAYKGNIDKYIGDAIMAFWSAPLTDKEHIFHACQAVLTCKKTVHEMNQQWAKLGKPLLPTRFGINTGTAIVGNVGSSDRLNYTALGDAINIASRLESLNKIYHTEIIVSDAVYENCRNQFLFRPLDIVQVRGKQQSTTIYELVASNPGSTECPPTPQQVELCTLSWEAYQAYRQENFDRAMIVYRDILNKFPDDEVAKIYLTRCEGSM